jgi:hypothetical protein
MADKSFPSLRFFSGALLLAIGVLHLGYGVNRMDFWSLFGAFVVAFGGYLALVYQPDAKNLSWLISLGVALRVALVFAFPLLSDDVYRFIWDGHLIAAGENPFAHLPAYYLETGHRVPGLTQALFDKLNSPGYYTIYPPVAQGVFTVAAWLSPDSWYGAAVVMKLFLLACELGSLWLLWRLLGARPRDTKTGLRGSETPANSSPPSPPNRGDAGGGKELPKTNLLYYWLNPLIIVEITGNLHFEGAMVFFLLLAYYLLQRSKWVAAAAAMAASVASKLLPLMLLPLLIRRLWQRSSPQKTITPPPGGARAFWESDPHFSDVSFSAWIKSGKRFYVFSVAFGSTCLLFFLPFLLSPDFIAGFQSSLELYQQKFEFNASLYYLARAYGYYQVGWNQIATIGPSLAKAAAGGILLMALLDRRSDWASLPAGWLWAFVLYLLCATTVHPWYLSVPIVLCCFTRWRFPLVWSFLIMLTYISYVTEPYEENIWLVGIEYLTIAGFAGWEWWRCQSLKA